VISLQQEILWTSRSREKSVTVMHHSKFNSCDIFHPGRLGWILNIMSTSKLHTSVFGKHLGILKYTI